MTQPLPNQYGSDFGIFVVSGTNAGNGILDADPSMRTVTGRALLIQSLLCRQTTPRGSVPDCPNDCVDIRDSLSDGLTPQGVQALASDLQTELLKDQRVHTCKITGNYNAQTATLTLTEAIESSQGPFTLVLAVSKVTVQLLNANLLNGT